MIVVGGGFSGLSISYYLALKGHKVRLFEKSERLGGLIGTDVCEFGRAEWAANGLMNSHRVEQLFKDLGVTAAPRAKDLLKKYIWRAQPRRWPLNVSESWSVLLRAPHMLLNRELLKPEETQSLRQWSEKNFGRGASENLILPAFQGVFAGDPDRLSSQLILGRFFESSAKSQKGAFRGTVAPLGGMQVLVDAFDKRLRALGVEIYLGESYAMEEVREPVIVATPAAVAAELLASRASYAWLREVEYLPLVSATVFRSRDDHLHRGFGCLFPFGQGFHSLGVIFDQGLFHQDHKNGAERWILGGATRPRITSNSFEEILDMVVRDGRRLYGEYRILSHHIRVWPQAVPHYTIELHQRLQEMSEDVILFGNYTGVLGLSQILERAYELAERL